MPEVRYLQITADFSYLIFFSKVFSRVTTGEVEVNCY